MKEDTMTDEGKCLWREFLTVVTRIMNVMGVQETVDILRSAANKLEANKGALEAKRRPRPTVRA